MRAKIRIRSGAGGSHHVRWFELARIREDAIARDYLNSLECARRFEFARVREGVITKDGLNLLKYERIKLPTMIRICSNAGGCDQIRSIVGVITRDT